MYRQIIELIDDILEPYAEAYTILVNKKYVAVKNAEQVNQYLFWLNKVGNSDWMSSAIRFMAEHKNEPDYVLWFMERLERLNAFVSDGAAKFDLEPNILTIEHVLPQTVRPGSEWEKLWPDASVREQWLNRIANLVPLTRKKNSEAQNYDFDKKKEIYFKGKSGTTTYPLATQVLSEKAWTPEIVELRQKELMNKFIEC